MAYALLRAEQAGGPKNVWCGLAPGEEAPASRADEADRLLSLVPSTVR
jgi:hypothetical protein